MKKLYIKIKEPKIRKHLPSQLVVTKIHKSDKAYKRKKFDIRDIDLDDRCM